jgi:hypothetical protein
MLEFHPLANLFPLLEGAEFEALVADIKANGIHEKIVMHEGKILDGRNRYRAGVRAEVIEAGVIAAADRWLFVNYYPDLFEEDEGPNPLDWVLSKNLHRRHLSESQRAMVAAKLANMQVGQPEKYSANLRNTSRKEAAGRLKVSERSVDAGKAVQRDGAPELIEAVESGKVAVSAAAELAKLPANEQAEILRTADPKALAKVAKERRHEREGVNGARAIMAGRLEPDDSLDYFPTPPWATRALLEDVLPHLGIDPHDLGRVWEPACGEGHISGVLAEYGCESTATDIFDYSVDGRQPPGWAGKLDFLVRSQYVRLDDRFGISADWIITNPPFGDKILPFVRDAILYARAGVAMFVRQQWLEGIERYEDLFANTPPTLYAQFAERVNLCKGRWDPAGTTATAYCWLVWIKDMAPQPVYWIPPGRRSEHFRADDEARFTAHPVIAPTPQMIVEIRSRLEGRASPSARDNDGAERTESEVVADAGGEAGLPPDLNTIIRDGYGRNAPLAELAKQTGLSAMAVKSRAKRMGLGDPARQRQAVAASNRRRSKSGGGPE